MRLSADELKFNPLSMFELEELCEEPNIFELLKMELLPLDCCCESESIENVPMGKLLLLLLLLFMLLLAFRLFVIKRGAGEVGVNPPRPCC